VRGGALLIVSLLPFGFGCHLLFPFDVGSPGPIGPTDAGPDLVGLVDGAGDVVRPADGSIDATDDLAPKPDAPKPTPDASPTPDAPAPLTWTWKTMATPVNSDLYGVWGRSSSDVYAVGQNGTVLHYDGTLWKPLFWASGTTGSTLYVVRGSGPTYVYVAGAKSIVRKCSATSCGQPPFQDAKLPLPLYLRGLWCSGYNRCYLAGHDGFAIPGFFVGDNITSQTSWPELCKGVPGYAGQRLYSVWGRAWADVIVTGTSGTLLHLTGTSCKKVPTLTTTSLLFGAWAPPGAGLKDLVVVGGQGLIMRHDGTTWHKIPSSTTMALTGVWGVSNSNVVAVGTSGTILHYDGKKVLKVPALTTKALNAVWGDAGGYFAVGYGGVILRGTSNP
jgi:hypothetical protein